MTVTVRLNRDDRVSWDTHFRVSWDTHFSIPKVSNSIFLVVRFQGRYSTRRVHVSRKHDSRNPLVKRCPGTYVMACVSFAPDKRFRMDDTHRNFPRSDTKTTFWSTLAARRVAAVLGKTRQPSVESQWGNYASSPPVGAADCPQQQWW